MPPRVIPTRGGFLIRDACGINPRMGRWLWRLTKGSALLLAVVAGVVLVAGRALLIASLPRESGSVALPALAAEVVISRDDRGVPRVRASGEQDDFADIAAALGFLHAQDRFFQMDLMRRRAAGELAELFGPFALGSDREMRRLRLREVARGVLPRLPEHHKRWFDAYSRGVNHGLADLTIRPPEYLALMQSPREWLPEDSVLAALAMHHGLSMGARFELQYDVLNTHAPPGVADFLMPETSRFDAPLIGEPGDPIGPRPIPGPEALQPWASPTPATEPDRPAPIGSNNFAVSGRLTADGRAILANDMHLQLAAPNTWYHAHVEWGGRRAVGLTLPGVPGIVAGSNGRVAWGLTNATGDFEDWVIVEADSKDPARYRFGPGDADFEPFGEAIETIHVRGAPPERLALRTTRWGVVSQRDATGRPLVLKWPALDPATVNVNMLDMVSADSLETALECVRSWWGPPQNVLIASADGRIAWTISGWVPKREGFDGRTPASWAKAGVGWSGPIDESAKPALVDPPRNRLWSANARTLPLEQARVFGWCWAAADRASRIGELLHAKEQFTERDLLAIQLDTRAAMFDHCRDIILAEIAPDDADPMIAMARREVERWNGRADADSVGFRVLARFHSVLEERLLKPLWVQRRGADAGFSYWCMQDEEPLRRILEDRPAHFLSNNAPDWRVFFRGTLRESLRSADSGTDLPPDQTWGEFRRVSIRHPFALAAPMLGRFLNMPDSPPPSGGLPGHASTVRAQGRAFGASQRLVVSPGHEDDGILHMPGGQSGHPFSRHYSDGHQAWVEGRPMPLLAGPIQSEFRLVPR